MKRLKFLISQLYLLALLAFPVAMASCSDDDENTPISEIGIEGIESGTALVTGQAANFEAKVTNITNPKYSWSIGGKEVSTESTYSFISETTGSFTLKLIVTGDNKTLEQSLSFSVTTPSFYVINESQYGKPGSVNKYVDNTWQYEIVTGLGMTTTVGIINDGFMYIVSKTTPFLVKMNLNSNKVVETIADGIGTNGQGCNFRVVNSTMGVLTTTKGAFKINLNPLSLGEKLGDMDDAGDIFCANDYVFIQSNNVIKVFNAKDLSFKKEIATEMKTGFAQTNDGTLWAANGNTLIGINKSSLESKSYTLPDNLSVTYNFTYTPTGLCASTTKNALYFSNGNAYGNGKDIYLYDVTTNTATKFFEAPEKYTTYGAGVQVDPRNGEVYLIYTEEGYGPHNLNTYIYVANGVTGEQKSKIDYTGTYWYPSTITFD